MAGAEAFNFLFVFDSLEVRDRRARNGDVRIPKCLGDCNARLVTNQNLLVTLDPQLNTELSAWSDMATYLKASPEFLQVGYELVVRM